jgi:hypothetical protein
MLTLLKVKRREEIMQDVYKNKDKQKLLLTKPPSLHIPILICFRVLTQPKRAKTALPIAENKS